MSFIQGADGLVNFKIKVFEVSYEFITYFILVCRYVYDNIGSVIVTHLLLGRVKHLNRDFVFVLQMLEDRWPINLWPLQIKLCDRIGDACVVFFQTYHKSLNWIIGQCWYHLSELWYFPKCFRLKIFYITVFNSFNFLRIFGTRLVGNSS